MKLINKYTELRDEIYNDLVNKIEISKKDKKQTLSISISQEAYEVLKEIVNEENRSTSNIFETYLLNRKRIKKMK